MAERIRAIAAAAMLVGAWVGISAQATRVFAIDATWNPGAAGNWSDPSHWSTNPDVPNSASYDVFINDGQTTIDDAFTIGALNWNGGALAGTGPLTVTLATTIGGPSPKLLGGPTINLNGDAAWVEGNIGTVDPPEGGVVNVGAEFDVQVDATWSWNMTNSPIINVSSAGAVVKSAGNGFATILPVVNNNGVVHVQSGGLRLGGGGTSNGEFIVDDGAQLEFADRHAVLAAQGALITKLDAGSMIDAADGGLVRFGHGSSDSQADLFGVIDATELESDPGANGRVVFRSTSQYGANERGTLTASSGTTRFDNAIASLVDVIVNDAAVVELVNSATLNIRGAVNVNSGGVLQIGDASLASLVVLDGSSSQLITGGGDVVLGGEGNVLDSKRRMVVDDGTTIRGRGQIIGANKAVSPTNGSNLGTIAADVAGGTLRTDFLNNSN
jgi:hypothetical protein